MLVLLWACRLVFMVLVRKLTWFSRFLYHPHVQPGIYIDLLTQRVVDSLRLWGEWSVGVNIILYYDPASQKGLVYKVFWKILSRQESQPQQARRIILWGWPSFLSPFITAWIEPKKGHVLPAYYSHWIPRSSQLTFHRRSAVFLFRALGDTQVLLQSLVGVESEH